MKKRFDDTPAPCFRRNLSLVRPGNRIVVIDGAGIAVEIAPKPRKLRKTK